MKTTYSAVLLFSVASVAAEVELFVDKGDTYVRAGSEAGLSRGSAVTVVTKGGKKIGTGTVMETWPQLARVSLDEAARGDKSAAKYVALPGPASADGVAPAPPPPPPPPPPDARRDTKREPVPSAHEPPAAAGALKGFARYWGAGPWTVLQVFNENAFDWTDCQVTMLPMKASYHLRFLKAGDHEAIGKSNFSRTDFSDNPTSVPVSCKQGQATLLMR